MNKTIVVACDHAGYILKADVIEAIEAAGFSVIDVGTYTISSADFPDFAQLGTEKIIGGQACRGVFICGTGVGVCLAANKIPGIYASVCHDTYSAHQGVEHNNMNVLCLGGRIIGGELAKELVRTFLHAEFNGKPNQIRRTEKIRRIEAGDLYLSDKIASRLECGQSIWYRSLSREKIRSGELAAMVKDGSIRGLLSSSCSLYREMLESNDYDASLTPMVLAGWSAKKIVNQLSVEDIREAAGIFRDLYVESQGIDGYVTLSVNPSAATDPEQIIAEAKQIWTAVNRPNLMIGIPATPAGLDAASRLIENGMNIMVEMVRSDDTFQKASDALLRGLESRLQSGNPLNKVHAVISIPVADIQAGSAAQSSSCDKTNHQAALWSTQHLYNLYQAENQSERAQKLQAAGAPAPRLLWVSLEPQSPDLDDLYYTNALLGENTILGIFRSELEPLKERGSISPSLPVTEDEIETEFQRLGINRVDFQTFLKKTEELNLTECQQKYDATSKSIDEKTSQLKQSFGTLYDSVLANFQKLEKESLIARMFAKDPTIWTFNVQAYPEIRNRLGWLDPHQNIPKMIEEYQPIVRDLKANGFKKALLLGMGGSSLAPEVLALTFPNAEGLKLEIVDSTDPVQVLESDRRHPLAETVYIVSSKSGGTAEVRAFLDYFYTKAQAVLGSQAGSHFIAITDPGTQLERKAQELGFRHIVTGDPSIGGRFSALSPFGILPAMLIGIDPDKIYKYAARMAKNCTPSNPAGCNEGAALGVFIGTAALNGRDKLTILTDPELAAFGSWLEQLIAESSGKDGKGIVPVDLEPELEPARYPADRAFVYVNTSGQRQPFVDRLADSGQPVLTIKLNDLHEIFAEFYRWEIAVSIACGLLEVNPFDQPDVQDSKTRTIAKINEYLESGTLQELPAAWSSAGVEVNFEAGTANLADAANIKELVKQFIRLAKTGEDYIAINAYLPRNATTTEALQEFRNMLLAETNCATTLGFGPRFQHSTGQLHKGGANNGVFIQIVANSPEDVEIPNQKMTFSVLERAQALGDFEALRAVNRRAIRINLGTQPVSSLV